MQFVPILYSSFFETSLEKLQIFNSNEWYLFLEIETIDPYTVYNFCESPENENKRIVAFEECEMSNESFISDTESNSSESDFGVSN